MAGDQRVDDILQTEFSEPFAQGMRDRMVVSFYKYGKVEDAAGKVDFLASLTDRLIKYRETGNTEYLIDAANFAMMEFMFPQVPGAYFAGTDDDGSPGRRTRRGVVDKRDNATIGTNPNSKTAQFR